MIKYNDYTITGYNAEWDKVAEQKFSARGTTLRSVLLEYTRKHTARSQRVEVDFEVIFKKDIEGCFGDLLGEELIIITDENGDHLFFHAKKI